MAVFEQTFSEKGNFVKKVIKERTYWYFRTTDAAGKQKETYAGPETKYLLGQIETHRKVRSDERRRRSLVAMLRTAGLPTPVPEVGQTLATMMRAGIFRHRACVVGTHAFGAYSGLLGVKFKSVSIATQDMDFAQFRSISVAVGEDEKLDLYGSLRSLDSSYRPVSKPLNEGKPVAYVNDAKSKIEILTPLQGPDTDDPIQLPSMGTYAHGFRFLDFLIAGHVPALVLFGDGVLVNVPLPERYAVHKLIVAERRSVDRAKALKDLSQAEQLIEAMWQYQRDDLLFAFKEAIERGPTWRDLVGAGLAKLELPPGIKDELVDLVSSGKGA